MKSILAFGDSLTWGHDPRDGSRHAYDDRWTSVLEAALDGAARLIPEGLNGRTTSFDDHAAPCCRNGARALPMLLTSHMPLDLVIVMLGTNDLKPRFGGRAVTAQEGMRRLAEIVRLQPTKPEGHVPRLLIVAPPPCAAMTGSDLPAGERSVAESHRIAPLYRTLAEELDCAFFDAGAVARADPADGVHLDAANTRAIGAALLPMVRALL
ncbi:lysophospholipase L1-like esterase [Limimaricola variabilis]|uniref:Lysophospholipase L1-like esterase n=1 Tax=Limimaricola variabilis TaxID=1492771 RepID=A0ABR6HT78_9RHOB|nr:SGNH/GDSL hydrolase family protein [Limimaricola variabilis]MBB3713579.1 lysophospholipase L1-like esterase [Limimaricola variabilis]